MLIDEINEELQELLDDPTLRLRPADATRSEAERWLSWMQGDHSRYLPSPAEIDASAKLIRTAAEQAEISGRTVHR